MQIKFHLTNQNFKLIKSLNFIIKVSVFIFLLKNTSLSVFSQQQQLQLQEQFTTADGLSQGMIYDILQDKSGFMWFATKEGLNQYNGYSFKTYTNNPSDTFSISEDITTALLEDGKGRIWVGTSHTGLNCFNKKTGRFFQITIPNTDLLNHFIYQIMEDKDGNIWLVFDSALVKIIIPNNFPNGEELQFESFPIKEYSLTTMLETTQMVNDSTIWMPSDDGFLQFSVTSKQLDPLKFDTSANQSAFGVFVDAQKRIWAGIGENLWIADGQKKQATHLSKILDKADFQKFKKSIRNNYHFKMEMIEQTGSYWLIIDLFPKVFMLSLEDSTLNLRLEKTLFAKTENQFFRQIYQDKSGMIWLGTNGFGIYKYNPLQASFQNMLPNVSIRNLLLDQTNQLWCKSNQAATYRIEGGKVKRHTESGFNINDIHGLIQTEDGDFWVANFENKEKRYHLYHLDAQFNLKRHYQYQSDKPLKSYYGLLSPDAWGNIWVALGQHYLVRFNPKTKKFSTLDYAHLLADKQPSRDGFAFYKDIHHDFWIGKGIGLVRLKVDENGKMVDFNFHKNDTQSKNTLNRNIVLSCLDDPQNPEDILWVGTRGGGLNRLDKKTGTVQHFTTEQGLPNNTVYAILSDEAANLWLSTNRGLAQFNPRNQNFRNYTKADGLQDNEFNTNAYCKDEKNGTLYFGGINGVTAFQPKTLYANQFTPPVLITSLKIHNEEFHHLEQPTENAQQLITYLSDIELTHHQNSLTFEFAALDFTNPTNNQYQFILEGAMQNWEKCGNRRTASFPQLAPGKYVFKVKGTSNGVWSENITSLRLTINPPWWKTTWAYTLWWLLVLGSIYILYRFQINRIKLHNQLAFEQKEMERLSELNRIKTNFFSNITHEFRTPLTLIIEPVRELLRKYNAAHYNQQLKLVQNNGERLLLLVNQLLDLSKLEGREMSLDLRQGNLLEVIRTLIQSFEVLAEKKGIELKMNMPPTLNAFYFDKDKVEKVCYNLLSNAIKFTEKGSVMVVIKQANLPESDFLYIQITDTGCGIDNSNLTKIFERFYQTNASSTRMNEGTGIGLALVKELVELMGGKISAESELGKGTTLTWLLPIRKTSDKIRESFSETNEQQKWNSTLLEKTPFLSTDESIDLAKEPSEDANLILIIEDNADMRQFIRFCLPNNYTVLEAANGEEGIQKAIHFVPDLIISDVMMPKKDGFEVVEILRQNEKTSHIPLILLTAKTATDNLIKGIDKGADAYLTKPFNTEELLVRIRKLIEIRASLQQKYQQSNLDANTQIFPKKEQAFFKKMNQVIEENLDNENLTMSDFTQKIYMSRTQVHRKLKALTNQSATAYIRNYRLDAAKKLLEENHGNITAVSDMVGFKNRTYFSVKFKERFGYPPSQVAKR